MVSVRVRHEGEARARGVHELDEGDDSEADNDQDEYSDITQFEGAAGGLFF